MAGFSGRTGTQRGGILRADMLRAGLIASTMLMPLPLIGAQAQTATAARLSFDLPAQPLRAALTAFARQTGIKFAYPAALTSGRTSPALRGSFSAEEALARLLGGSGLIYAFTSPTSVTISAPAPAGGDAAAADGTIELGTIDVNAGGNPANLPYETPGSTNYISGAEIERFPGLTAGAIFQSTPGVISGSSNNGGSVDPNIRGLQGMNRVATTIDGSQQATSSYRGYNGVDSRTYIDPDLISGITITKGPDGAVPGAIGGTIAAETLGVADILDPGQTYGARVRAGLTSGLTDPVIGQSGVAESGGDAPGPTNISLALATTSETVDFVAAFVRRKTGNYSAGSEGSLTYDGVDGPQRLSSYGYGQEVYNTSEDVTSVLLKTVLRPTDEQEIKLAYMHYDNVYGEVTPGVVNVDNYMLQMPLNSVSLDQATVHYHYKPVETDLVDIRANAYVSNIDETVNYAAYATATPVPQNAVNAGISASNTSRFMVASTPLAVTFGGSYRQESGTPVGDLLVDYGNGAIPPDAQAQVASLFGRAKWEPWSWLAVEGELQYINYQTTYLGVESWSYEGPDFATYAGDGVSPSISVTLSPAEGWQIYAQYQTGIRPPSLREVSMTRGEQLFNPDLDAENARNFEVGVNFLRENLFKPGDEAKLKLAYFDNKTYDYIGREYENARMILFNYDYVQFQGVEFSGGYDAGWGFVDFGINYYTGFNACLDDGACIDYTLQADYLTNQVPPEFTASLTAGLRFWDDRVTVGGRVTYVGERLAELYQGEDDLYFFVTKAWAPYTVVDLFGQWKINDHLTLDVGVQNLLDAYYVDALNNTDMPAPGRTITLGLTGKLGGEGPLPALAKSFPKPNGPWTGPYAGVNAGFGYGGITGTTTAGDGSAHVVAASESADQSLEGLIGGFQGGFDYQFANNLVVGIEADFSWMQMQDEAVIYSTETAALIARDAREARIKYQYDWLSTVRARIGYAAGSWMVYGTGGLAFLKETEQRGQYLAAANPAYSTSAPAPSSTTLAFTETADNVRTGFSVGAGAEYAFGSHWSVKAEYLYAGFGAEDFLFGNGRGGVSRDYQIRTLCRRGQVTAVCSGASTGYVYQSFNGAGDDVIGRTASNEANLQLFRIGLNYRF